MSQTAQLMWYILVLGVVGVGALLVAILASRLFKKRSARGTDLVPFTIQNLRDMRRRGEITEKEFEAMRAVTIAQMTTPESPEQGDPSAGDRKDRQPPTDTPGSPRHNRER